MLQQKMAEDTLKMCFKYCHRLQLQFQ